MARELASTVRRFLKTQVLRSDYIIVGELPSRRTCLPYELKLERMHNLCIHNGYRISGECEKIRRLLYTDENKADRPASLLLIEAYLPSCIVKITDADELLLQRIACDLEREARNLPGKACEVQSGRMQWGGDCYLMCLPLDIHFLLIEHDGALLAA